MLQDDVFNIMIKIRENVSMHGNIVAVEAE